VSRPQPTHCGYADCGEALLEDAYVNLWDGYYCNERCAILDLLEKSLRQMQDPRHQNVPDLLNIAIPAVREAHQFALGVPSLPKPTPE
jgi:hypothetical protein